MGSTLAPSYASTLDANALPQFLVTPTGTPYGDSLVASKSTALQRFFYCLGLAQTGAGVCDFLHIGDSITTGYQLLAANRWQKLLAALMRAKFQPAGVAGGWGYFSAMQAIATPADWPFAATGTTLSNFDGPGAKCAYMGASGNKLVWTTGPVTSVDLFYARNSVTGSFSYKVDGGASTVISAGGTSSFMTPISITGLGGTTHTIEVDWVSNLTVGPYICGGIEYNGDETTGLRFWDAGRSSAQCAYLAGVGSGANANWFNDLSVIQPALVTIELGYNDCNVSPYYTAAQFKTNLLSLIASVNEYCTVAPSIVLIPVWPGTPGAQVDTWTNFVNLCV
jgi:hypothetical protein